MTDENGYLTSFCQITSALTSTERREVDKKTISCEIPNDTEPRKASKDMLPESTYVNQIVEVEIFKT